MIAALRTGREGSAQKIALTLGLVALLAAAWLEPTFLPVLLASLLVLGAVAIAYRQLVAAWVVWLLIAGLSLEMALSDLIGPDAFQDTIAAVKGAEIGLVGLMIMRFGPTPDRFNPAFGFVTIAGMGAIAGTHPNLSGMDMLRSLVGSVTPFLVFFCRKPPGWGALVLRGVTWAPLLSVVLGAIPDLLGLRPMLMESGGIRLAGLGHPAFLAGVCLPAIYSGLLRWLRTASRQTAGLLAINLVILFLTGARAPTAYAAIVIGVTLIVVPDSVVPRAHRLALFAIGCTAVPIFLFVGETYSSLRLFEILSGEAGHLSGRDLLWPAFEQAAAQAPWFGWGLGAGNLVIPHDGPVALLLHTWAAHNEYLRILVEGGQVGRTLLIVLFVLWVTSHSSRLPRLERQVMRLIFLTYAGHAVTDNVLISTPACVFFAFVAAVYAAADDDASNRLREALHVA